MNEAQAAMLELLLAVRELVHCPHSHGRTTRDDRQPDVLWFSCAECGACHTLRPTGEPQFPTTLERLRAACNAPLSDGSTFLESTLDATLETAGGMGPGVLERFPDLLYLARHHARAAGIEAAAARDLAVLEQLAGRQRDAFDPNGGVMPSQAEIEARFDEGVPARRACPVCKVDVPGMSISGQGAVATVFLPQRGAFHAGTCSNYLARAWMGGTPPHGHAPIEGAPIGGNDLADAIARGVRWCIDDRDTMAAHEIGHVFRDGNIAASLGVLRLMGRDALADELTRYGHESTARRVARQGGGR
jgi:hypothetical protein